MIEGFTDAALIDAMGDAMRDESAAIARPERESADPSRRAGETSSVPSGFLLCHCCLGERCRRPCRIESPHRLHV
jgi:hypothetical protein